MHTILVLAGGCVLLGICLLAGKLAGGSTAATAKAALIFLPLWFVGSAVNLRVGLTKAGYTVGQELPIFAVIFAHPSPWRCWSRGKPRRVDARCHCVSPVFCLT